MMTCVWIESIQISIQNSDLLHIQHVVYVNVRNRTVFVLVA